MRKIALTLSLLATLAVAPGIVGSAYADHYGDRHDRSYRGSAWSVVRRDPCRYNEYVRFARKHENESKRARFVERLAREGCDRDAWKRFHGVREGRDHYRGPYGASDEVVPHGSVAYVPAPSVYAYANPVDGISAVFSFALGR